MTKTAIKPKRAITYSRISFDLLAQGAGVERQGKDTDAECERRGFTVVERIVDNDRSASKYARKTREGWARVLALLASGEVDALVAYNLDRLTRRPKDLEPLIEAAERGVEVIIITNTGLDLSTANGVMLARFLLGIAEAETSNTSRRQKDKLRHDADAGRPHWVRRPFGYELGGKVVEHEARWIRQMVSWLADDGLSLTQVAIKLNEAGVAQASGKRWQSAGVKMLLVSPRNVGLRSYRGSPHGEGTWKPILTHAEWNRVKVAIAARSYGARQGRRSMLTGLVWCERCNLRMTRAGGEYRCVKHHDLGTGCGQSINGNAVEDVAAQLVFHANDVTAAPRHERTPIEDGDDIGQLQADLADLAAMLGNGELTMPEFRVARAPMIARLNAAEALAANTDASAALARLAGDHRTLSTRWDSLDNDLRRRIVGTVVERLVISTTAPPDGTRHAIRDRVKPVVR